MYFFTEGIFISFALSYVKAKKQQIYLLVFIIRQVSIIRNNNHKSFPSRMKGNMLYFNLDK